MGEKGKYGMSGGIWHTLAVKQTIEQPSYNTNICVIMIILSNYELASTSSLTNITSPLSHPNFDSLLFIIIIRVKNQKDSSTSAFQGVNSRN